jgi:hypothetical protein
MSELLQPVQNQTYSFLNLLENCSVKIPIIQRDYAQGRKTDIVEQVRSSFLDSIANSIKRAKKNVTAQPLSLDFIYGTIENNFLEPIDGQQRLTTLFLLHWYYAAKENRCDVSGLLQKFEYQTRTSSTEFCTRLCVHMDAFKEKVEFNNSLSEAIRDSSWFMLVWIDDPTVAAMLTMLDAIDRHPVLGTLDDVYSLFENNSPIVFQFLPIEKFGKGEELYIKMNSRGKRLTDYENFKALFGKQLHQDTNLSKNYWNNIDGAWSKHFWNFISTRYLQKVIPIDQYSYKVDNTILRYLWLQFEMIWSKGSKEQRTLSPFYSSGAVRFNFELVRESLVNSPDIAGMKPEKLLLSSLELSADFLKRLNEIIGNTPQALSLWDTDNLADTFLPMETIKNGVLTTDPTFITYQQRILVFSAIVWCAKNGVVPDNDNDMLHLQGYLRIIRNALTRIRNIRSTREGEYTPNLRFENIGNIIMFITEHLFSDISCTGYEALAKIDDKTISDLFSQMVEEKRKALYAVIKPSVLKDYHEAEDFPFLRGTIGQMLDDQGNLVLPHDLLSELFASSSIERGLLLTRAMLAVSGNFYLPITNERIRFGGKTENQWLVGLTYSNEQTKHAFRQFAAVYKRLRPQQPDCEHTLKAIVTEYLSKPIPWFSVNNKEDWRYYFVKYPQSMESYDFSSSTMLHPLDENLENQPIYIWKFSEPFTCRTVLNGVRRTRPHTNTFTWIAAQDKRISNYFDASASWQSGNENCNAVFNKNGQKIEVACTTDGFLVSGLQIHADSSCDRVEKLVREIQNI